MDVDIEKRHEVFDLVDMQAGKPSAAIAKI
jgi:hypothetical protein